MTKHNSPIHIKIQYDEAVSIRKDVLNSEMNTLKMLKFLRKYSLLRKEELKAKQKFFRLLKRIDKNIKKLETTLPEFNVPKILKKPHKAKKEQLTRKRAEGYKGQRDIEAQLREIQEKLEVLSSY